MWEGNNQELCLEDVPVSCLLHSLTIGDGEEQWVIEARLQGRGLDWRESLQSSAHPWHPKQQDWKRPLGEERPRWCRVPEASGESASRRRGGSRAAAQGPGKVGG